MSNPIIRLLEHHGILFSVERNGIVVSTVKGIRQYSTIEFLPNTDIQVNDVLINPSNERVYVSDTHTDYYKGEACKLVADFLTDNQKNSQSAQNQQTVFNISNASNSVIGNNNYVVFDYSAEIDKAEQKINTSNTPDKEELQEVIELLRKIVDNQIPVSKGLFSRFSAVMERHSWITNSISSVLLAWLIH